MLKCVIILVGFLVYFVFGLIYQHIEANRPVYMKEEGFFKMYDNETPISDSQTDEKFANNYSYIKDGAMYLDAQWESV